MEEWLNAVANVGFPIVVAFYIMIRLEGKMDALTVAVHDLSQNIRYSPPRTGENNT
jgi:hypothetical protein